ncbi:MAG: hypothetical protein LBQ79_07780 [Deltaproteobacteria bacterium]|nr:hypothetical protein [Deltaproteobacteria bacterium]
MKDSRNWTESGNNVVKELGGIYLFYRDMKNVFMKDVELTTEQGISVMVAQSPDVWSRVARCDRIMMKLSKIIDELNELCLELSGRKED